MEWLGMLPWGQLSGWTAFTALAMALFWAFMTGKIQPSSVSRMFKEAFLETLEAYRELEGAKTAAVLEAAQTAAAALDGLRKAAEAESAKTAGGKTGDD